VFVTVPAFASAQAARAPEETAVEELIGSSVPVSLSFFAPYALQPGVRLGVDLSFNECGSISDRRRAMRRRLFAGPRLSYLTRPQNHRTVMVGGEFGWESTNLRRGLSSQLSLGVNYMASAQITSVSIDLGTGAATNTRELQHYAVPTVAYRFLDQIGGGPEWFLGAAFGRKLSAAQANSTYFAVEAGIRFRLGGSEQVEREQ
jgi:hypothetical protein